MTCNGSTASVDLQRTPESALPYRFVHAADIHLDSPLRSLALRDADLAELIGNATRRAFSGVVKLCLEEKADALLLSGDLYDGDQTSMKTARFLADCIRQLHEAGIAVFIIRGNHDALSRITRELIFPDSVKLFGRRAQAVQVARARGEMPIAIHGISFENAHAPESLLARFAAPVEGAVNIGMLHTSLAGAPGHDPYAPCEISALRAAGFRYWALGHIHGRAAEEGAATIVMPGMPQGRDIGEAGEKSVTLATVADDGSIHIEARPTSVAQFERVSVDLSGISEWRGMVHALAGALGQARDGVAAEHLVARLHLTGATKLAWRLQRDPDLLLTEAQGQAAAIGRTWIDKIEIGCTPPATAAAPANEADPLVELRQLMADAADNEAFQGEITQIAEELRGLLPPECRDILGGDAASSDDRLREAVRAGIDDVYARLAAGVETAAD